MAGSEEDTDRRQIAVYIFTREAYEGWPLPTREGIYKWGWLLSEKGFEEYLDWAFQR